MNTRDTIPEASPATEGMHFPERVASAGSCERDAAGYCITCADEALPARIERVDQEAGMALVTVADMTQEIDITLVDDVVPGDQVLVHGGIAIARIDSTAAGEVNDA